MEQKWDGETKAAGEADYFLLTGSAQSGITQTGATVIVINSIAPGDTATFVIAPHWS